jgi:hypothetical protein
MFAALLLLAAASGARYPISLDLQPSSQASTATYNHQQAPGGLFAPPAETSVAFVGKQAVDAYSGFVSQFFQAAAQQQLALDLLSVTASVELKNDGWHAVVVHHLEVRDASDAVLGAWTIEGRGLIVGLGEAAVPAAFQAATVMAERAFEARFEDPPGVLQLLSNLGVEKGTVARRPEVAEAPRPPPPTAPFMHPERRELAIYLDAGGRFADLTYSSTSHTAFQGVANVLDDNRFLPGADLRIGIAGGWFFLQGGFSSGSGGGNSVLHSLTAYGADAGVRVKLNRAFEVAVGAGFYAARLSVSTTDFGPKPVTQVTSQTYPDVLAAIYLTPPFGKRFHVHIVAEGRYRLASMDTSYIDNTYHDHVNAGFSAALLLGVEIPLLQWGQK